MSAIIKGMEMPIQCVSCPCWKILNVKEKIVDVCGVTNETVYPFRRSKNCPMIEVKESTAKLMLAESNAKSDIVPVIRCKDCKYYESEYANCTYIGWQTGITWESDNYCSYAERKEE